jgi:hypothetical protein
MEPAATAAPEAAAILIKVRRSIRTPDGGAL